MIKKMKLFSLGLGLVGVAWMAPGLGIAAGPCVNCHTMHNSQGGAVITDNPTANSALINAPGGCIGCHTGTNNGAVDGIPFVLDAGAAPTATSLAGGNFYWVADAAGNTDVKGHNVVGISAQDAIGLTPPGWSSDFDAYGTVGQVGSWTTQLTCAGTNGCHGDHTYADQFAAVSGAHHTNDATITGVTTGNSFRFLLGILGYEDTDWEFATAADNHNQYFGYARTDDIVPTAGDATKTINYLCAECHGNFHSGAVNLGALPGDDTTAAWIRHPSDFDMNEASGTEYQAYGGSGTNAYQPLVPLASDDVSAPLSTVLNASGDAIVSCISCHRAHGSAYDDLLRWDYADCDAGTDNADCGCFQCHTTKDAG